MLPSLLFIVLFLFMGRSFGGVDIGKDATKLTGNYLICHCRGPRLNTYLYKTLDAKTARKIFDTLASSYNLKADIHLQPDLKDLKQCETCKLESFICNQKQDPSRPFCFKRTASFVIKTLRRKIKGAVETKRLINMLKIENSFTGNDIKEVIVGGLNRKTRSLRRTDVCLTPSSMQTASLSCVAGEFFVRCMQRCAFGYTLEDGIVRELICKYNEDVWIPTKFEECFPFIDCRIMLVNGGFANCTSLGVEEGPECRTTCLPFEDKEETPEQSYRCQIDGTWDPPLPFCAEPQKGMALVKAPSIKLHRDTQEWHYSI